MQRFRLSGVDHQQFEPLFSCSDEQLRQMGAVRRRATDSPGFPCRVSLEEADVGDELLLLPFVHQPAASPYRASGPVFIRRGARQRVLAVGEVPACVSQRVISLRAYDAAHMMIAATVCEGAVAALEIVRAFANADVAYIHLHNAKQGCFSCLAERA